VFPETGVSLCFPCFRARWDRGVSRTPIGGRGNHAGNGNTQVKIKRVENGIYVHPGSDLAFGPTISMPQMLRALLERVRS
jgi:hypothetical protein